MTDEEVKQFTNTIVTVAVAAAIFKVSQVTIYRWLNEGVLEGIKVTAPGHKRSTYRVKSDSIRRLWKVDASEGVVQ